MSSSSRFAQWATRLFEREKNRPHAVVYPERNLMIVVLVAGALWYAAASQNSGLAYFLLFWLVSLVLVSAVRARANVGQLEVILRPVPPTFADQSPHLQCELVNPSGRSRYALHLKVAHLSAVQDCCVVRLGPGESRVVELVLAPVSRGIHRIEAFEVESRFPFQVLVGRAWIPLHASFMIYPKRSGSLPIPETRTSNRMEQGDSVAAQGDDFYGLKKYVPGDSQRQVDWKAVARGHPMMTKQFGGAAPSEICLDWRFLEDLGFEARLSQLTRWCCEAEANGQLYALRLPRTEIPAGNGEAHLENCLKTLALFRLET